MFVYFLHHIQQSWIKIGKANDLHRRVSSLGGISAYSIEKSHYLRLSSEQAAFRVERLLHKAFAQWRVPVEPEQRHDGDTEQFQLACWPRIVQFVEQNADLLDGATLQIFPQRTSTLKGIQSAKTARSVSTSMQTAKEAFVTVEATVVEGVEALNALPHALVHWRSTTGRNQIIVQVTDPTQWAIAENVAEKWMDLTMFPFDGRRGSARLFPTIYSKENEFVLIEMDRMDDDLFFAPYRDTILQSMRNLVQVKADRSASS